MILNSLISVSAEVAVHAFHDKMMEYFPSKGQNISFTIYPITFLGHLTYS